MSSDIYLKLTVEGQVSKGASLQARYEGLIELDSFSWSMAVKDSPVQGRGKTSTRLGLGELSLSRVSDGATPRLLNLLKSRNRFTTAEIFVEDQLLHDRASGESGSDNAAMTVTFYNGRIENITHSLDNAGISSNLTEKVTLSYDRVLLRYFPYLNNSDKRSSVANSTTFDSEKRKAGEGGGS